MVKPAEWRLVSGLTDLSQIFDVLLLDNSPSLPHLNANSSLMCVEIDCMRLDRFTSKFQLAIADAQSMALGRDHQFIEPIHLMFALLNQEGGSTKDLFSKIGVNTHDLRSKLSQALERLPKVEGADTNVQLSTSTINLLNLCDKYAQKRKDQYISSELFVLAACEDKSELGP
jgi:ATP-dependent Clp protease ATP-binding subunit ClpB